MGAFFTFFCFSSVGAFSDISGDPAEQAIVDLAEKGIITEKESFFPNTEINRAEFVKFTLAAFYDGDISAETESEMNVFPDIEKEAWYFPFVALAKKIGAVRGYQDGNFHPADSISRAEALKVILSLADFSPSQTKETQFSDVKEEEWSFPWVIAGEEICLLNIEDSFFFPNKKITRGEMAIWVFNLLAIQKGEKKCEEVIKTEENEDVISEEISASENLPLMTEVDTSDWTAYENDREQYDFSLPPLLFWQRDNVDHRLDASEDEEFENTTLSIRVLSGPIENNTEEIDGENFRMMVSGNEEKHFEIFGPKKNVNEIRAVSHFLKFWDKEAVRVSIDDAIEIPSIIPKNAMNVPVIALKITAPEKEAILLKDINIKRLGLGNSDEIAGVKLFEGWTYLGQTKTINRNTQKANFSLSSEPFEIPAGESRTLTVRVDFDASEFSEHFFEIESAEDLGIFGAESEEKMNLSGTFPLGSGGGALKNIPAGTLEVKIESSSEEIVAGSSGSELSRITIGETGGLESVMVSGFTLHFYGVSENTLGNLFVDFRGEQISPLFQEKNGQATFLLNEPIIINRGKEKTFQIRGTAYENTEDFSVSIENLADDLFAESAAQQ